MKEFHIDNIVFKLGENAFENWDMLSHSKPWYLFFHLSNFSSGFGILECERGVRVSNFIKRECVCILKRYTKYRNSSHIYTDCCECRNVKRGNVPGEIIYKSVRKVQHIMT